MPSSQGKLGDFIDDENLESSSKIRRAAIALREAPEGAEPFDPLSCPWCLGSKDDFVIRELSDIDVDADSGKQVSCGHCSAVIPINADWYLRGEKVCFQ